MSNEMFFMADPGIVLSAKADDGSVPMNLPESKRMLESILTVIIPSRKALLGRALFKFIDLLISPILSHVKLESADNEILFV